METALLERKWGKKTTNIEKYSIIRPDELDTADYFSSLIFVAEDRGLLSPEQLEAVQQDTMRLLEYITRRYTGFDSTSVTVDRAQELLESALFTVGVQLKTFSAPDEALNAVLKDGLLSQYRAGREHLNELLSRAHSYQTSLLENLFPTGNEFYSATVLGGISGFFKLYRPDYAAQEIHITADYPTLIGLPPLKGAEFIVRYLRQLCTENAFLNLFDPLLIDRLLRAHEPRYEHIPLNLCQPMLCAALGCELLGLEPRELKLRPDDVDTLSRRFAGLSREEAEGQLRKALAELSVDLELPRQMSAYLRAALPQIAALIESTSSSSLGAVFTIT